MFIADSWARRLAPLFNLRRPHFGQAVTWVLLYTALALAPNVCTVGPGAGRAADAATVLSPLPATVLSLPLLFSSCRRVLVLGAVLWACRLLIPWSCWITLLAFTATISICFENRSHISHLYNITNMLLLIHAMWYHFYRKDIRAALSAGTFWESPLYPAWAFGLSVFYIGLFHTWAGATKLLTSGPGWANGLSLQLWVYLWGDPTSPLREFIISNRWAAQGLQAMTLAVETSALLVCPFRRLRVLVGASLLGLYIGMVSVFGYYGFYYNALFVVLFFLPIERGMAALHGFMIRVRTRFSFGLPTHLFARIAAALMLYAILKIGSSFSVVMMVVFVCFLCLKGVAEQRGRSEGV